MNPAHRLHVLLLAVIVLGQFGCRSRIPPAELNITSGPRQLKFAFHDAYFDRADGGNYDVILREASEKSGVTHVLHLRILWRPAKAIRADNPTAANAVVRWLATDQASGRLQYDGVGFARADADGDRLFVRLSQLQLALTNRAGALNDAISAPAQVEANFTASKNPVLVRNLIASIRDPLPQAPPNPGGGPPARGSTGP